MGAGVTGGGVTGGGVTGAGVVGATGATGAGVGKAQPQGIAKGGRLGQKTGSTKPLSPALSKSAHVTCPWVGTSMTTVVSVTRWPAPQTSHGGKPGLGGTGAPTGAGVTGAGVMGAALGGINMHSQGPTNVETRAQNSGCTNPPSPAIWKLPQAIGS